MRQKKQLSLKSEQEKQIMTTLLKVVFNNDVIMATNLSLQIKI